MHSVVVPFTNSGIVYDLTTVEAVNTARMVWKMRRTFEGRKKWLKNPAGCKAFGPGYPCEFEDVCWRGARGPEGVPGELKTLSYSSMKEFLRCPERYRLALWTPREDDDRTAAGQAFHAAMAEIYKEMKNGQPV